MRWEKVNRIINLTRTLPDAEKFKRIETARKNGYINEEEFEYIIEKLRLKTLQKNNEKNSDVLDQFHKKAEESDISRTDNRRKFGEPIRPGKKINNQAALEQNIDDFLDEVDKQVDEWEVFPKEQYTIEKLREEIKKLLILNARVGETTEPRYRKEGDRYTATDRLRITADIGNRIEEILRVLEGYKAEMESEKPITGIRRKMPERKKRIFRVFWI